MRLYAGIDLHSNNNYQAIIDEHDQRVYQKRLPNKPGAVLAELAPFQEKLATLQWNLLSTGTGWWMP